MAKANDKLANCDECGRAIIAIVGLDLCPECFAQQVRAYERIEQVLAETPTISVSELSRRAEVKRSIIARLARKGRIKLRDEVQSLRCERCNKPMEEVGRFCSVCRARLMFEAKDAATTLQGKMDYEPRFEPGMRARAHGVVRALTRRRSIFRSIDYGTRGKYSP